MNLINKLKPKKTVEKKISSKTNVPLSAGKKTLNPKGKDISKKNDEIFAAIAASIFLYRSEVHDIEDTVLTIKRIDRSYSPWSSKIYGLRKSPR